MANDINNYGDLDIKSSLASSLSDAFPTIQRFKPENPKEESKLEFSKHNYLGLNLNEYEPYLGTSLLPNQDFNLMRAEAQPWTSELRNALFNLPGSIVGGIIENAGYMGALLTEWGDDRDYTNSWTEAGKGIKEWWKGNIGGEIYRKNPEKVWDTADSAWWIQNGEGLVESIGEFAVTGWGVGTALGKTAAVLSNLSKSAAVGRGLMNTAQVGTAASLAYTEGAMTGAQVYKDVYTEEYEKQLRDLGNQTEAAKRAKHKAATAAATAVHINTSINTLLNIGSVGTLFRSTNYLSSKAAESVGKKNAKRMFDATVRKADDKLDDIITRTSNLQYTPNTKGYYADLGIESLKEGIEEQVNLFAEESGMRVGKMDDKEFGKYEYDNWSSYLNQFEQLSHFAKDVFTEEGALNFVLGAIGGAGQNLVMKHTPGRTTDTDPVTGQKTTRWTTARAEQILREQQSFNKLQDSVVSDLRTFNKLSTKLDMLMKDDGSISEKVREKMIEDTRQELFDLEAYRSIRNGTGDYLKGTFEYIGNLDNNKKLSEHIEYNQRLQNLEAKIEEELAKPEDQRDDDKLTLMRESRDRLDSALKNPQMTQAMFEGYAEKPNTDTHKKRADKAIKEIDNYTKMYHDVMSTYNYGDERTAGLARTLFDLKLQGNTTKRKIERNKAIIDNHKESLREKFKDARYNNVDTILADAAVMQANIESLERKLEEINEGLDNVMLSKTDAERQVYIDKLAKKYPNEIQKMKAANLRTSDIEKNLIKIEDNNLKKETKNLEEQKEKLSKEKLQLLNTAFEAANVNNPIETAEFISNLSEDQLKIQRDDYIKRMEEDIQRFNAMLDNDLQTQYDDILQNELDNKFIMDEYAKLASSKGRKEFVENGKKFFENIKQYSEQKEKEAVKKQEKEEAKKKGYFTIEKTADDRYGLFDKDNKLVNTFDTEEEAINEAEKLNKKIDEDLEAKRKKNEETKKYTHIARSNKEQHAKNLTFLNDILDEQQNESKEGKILQTNEPTLETIDNVTFGTANKQGSTENNEDALYVDVENGVFVLADGMGGESSPVSKAANTSKDTINLLLGNEVDTDYDKIAQIAEKYTIHQVDEFMQELESINRSSSIPTIRNSIKEFFINLKLGEDLVNKRRNRTGATALKATRIKDNVYEIEKVGDTVYFVVDKDGNILESHGLSNIASTTGYMFSVRNGKPFISNPTVDKFTVTLNEGETLVLATDFIETSKAMEEFIASDFGRNLNFAEFQKNNKSDDSTFITIEYKVNSLDQRKADIERRRQELESSREILTLYDLTKPITEDSKEIISKIEEANKLRKEAKVKSEQAAKETNEEKKIALNSYANSLNEEAQILDKDVKTSRDSVINNTPIKQAITSAKSLGQKLLNKIKLAAKSNEWVSSMPISKEEFTKLEDATKKLSVKNMGEVTSNSEVIPDILLIEEINAKYDAELKTLEETSEDLSDVEYDDFINNEIVTTERIKIIGDKIATNKTSELTEREKAILNNSKTTGLVNEYLIKKLDEESKKVKSAIFTVDEFIKKYQSYEYKDANGTYSHVDFFDKYLDLLNVAKANGSTINIINDPNQPASLYAQGKNIYINVYHLNQRNNNKIIDNKYLSELLVHETIHTFVGNALVTNKAFFNDMKDLILSMGNGSTLAESFDKIKDNIKVEIDKVYSEPDSEDKKKRLDILRRAITVIDYCKRDTLDGTYERLVKNGMDSDKALLQAEQIALEEFITQALSEPEFAFYLNTVPSDNVIEGGPSMSIWQVLKKMLLELIDTVLNNRSKLQELNSILDKHLAKTTDGFDLVNIQSYFDLGTIAELGIYTHNNGKETRDVVILSIEGDTVIYSYPALLMDPSNTYRMTKDEFFNGNPTINENFRFEEFVKTMETVDFKSDDVNKIIEREKNQNYYNYLSIATKAMFDQYVKDKFDAVQNDLKTERINELINSIEKQTNITEIQGVLNIASKEFNIDSDEFKLLSNKVLETINKLAKNVTDLGSDTYIKLAKLTEFDDSFKHIFKQLEEIKDRVTKTIFDSIQEDLSKTTDLKKLKQIRNKYLKELKNLKEAYNNHLVFLTEKAENPLSKDDYELQIYINNNNLNNLEERLERKFISRLSDDDIKNTEGVEYAQILNEDGTVDKRLFKITSVTEDGYILSFENDSIFGEVEKEKVIRISSKHNFSRIYTQKEEIFDENYPRSILFDRITTEELNPQDYLRFLLQLNIIHRLRSPISDFQEAMAKSEIINSLPAFIINNGNTKKIIKELVDKVTERNSDNTYKLDEKKVEDEINKVVVVLSKSNIFKNVSQHDAREVFTSFLHSLSPEERNSTNFNDKIRVTVSKSTRASKLRNKMKSKSKNNIDEKLRIGLIKMNESKHEAYENKEEVIGIHGWDDITIDYEIKIGNKWIKIGSARNPYAYKAIKMEPASEIDKSPAHLYERYLKTTELNEKNAIVEEFNRLYSVKGEVVDNAKFESIGKMWLKQKRLYDALSKEFKDSKKDKISIEGEALSKVITFGFTGGEFNFTKQPKNRTNLNDKLYSNDDIERLKIDTDEGRKIAILDLKASKTPEETTGRPFNLTIDNSLIDGLDIYTYGSLPKQEEGYGRYWLVTKDLTGQFRFLWVKPRRIKPEEYNDIFIPELNKLIDSFNKGTLSQGDLVDNANRLFKEHVYLSLPAVPVLGSVQVFLNIDFDKKGKVNKNPNGSYKFNIKILPKEEGKTELLYLNDLDLTTYDNFVKSLYDSSVEALKKKPNSEFKPLTIDNVRISFNEDLSKFNNKNDKTPMQERIMDVFEIPVGPKVYGTNRLLTDVSDDISFETEEGEPEIDLNVLLASDELTPTEKELFDSLINQNRDAANIINFTKEEGFFTDKGNVSAKSVKSKVKISTEKAAKEALDLLVDLGFLNKKGQYYSLNKDFGKEIEPKIEEKEEIEETGIDLSEIKNKLLKVPTDKLIARSFRNKIEEQEYKNIVSKLVSNTHDDVLREQAVNMLISYYQDGKYTEAIDSLINDIKLGKMTQAVIDDPDLIRRKLIGCPKF
jgi:hypothetical protein